MSEMVRRVSDLGLGRLAGESIFEVAGLNEQIFHSRAHEALKHYQDSVDEMARKVSGLALDVHVKKSMIEAADVTERLIRLTELESRTSHAARIENILESSQRDLAAHFRSIEEATTSTRAAFQAASVRLQGFDQSRKLLDSIGGQFTSAALWASSRLRKKADSAVT